MSVNCPSKSKPDREDSEFKSSDIKKTTRFRDHGDVKNFTTQYKESGRQNREKFKEFQERYAVLKEKLPKPVKHFEEITKEVTSTMHSLTVQEKAEVHSASSSRPTDEADTVAKIIRDRDECSQKTKAALEVLEEKKHQFLEYQNMIARVQKDFDKTDFAKIDIQKGSMEQTQQILVDLEKEALQKDVEDKGKVIRSLQLKVDKLTQMNEELKFSSNNTVTVPADALDNSFLISEIQSNNERIKSLTEINETLINDRKVFEEKILQQEKDIVKLHGVIDHCIEKVAGIATILDITNADEPLGVEQLESKICSIEVEIVRIQQSNKDAETEMEREKDSGMSMSSSIIKDTSNKGSKRNKSQQRGRNNKPKSPWSSITSQQDRVKPSKEFKSDKSEDSPTTKLMLSGLEASVTELNERILENELKIKEKNQEIENIRTLLCKKDDELLQITAKYNEIYQLSQTKSGADNEILETEKAIKNIESENIMSFPETTLIDQIAGSVDESTEKINMDMLELKLEEAQKQIDVLSKQLDDANKNMIKTKATHKTKAKQMQKTIDSFSKMSDANSEVIRLHDEVAALVQKVAELEEDKGNLQLHLVDYDSVKVTDKEGQPVKDLQQIAEIRLQAISELEMQKFDLVQELHAANKKNIKLEEKIDELIQLENDHVSSQMNSVQLEEQLDKFNMECKSLNDQLHELKMENDHLNDTIQKLNQDKSEINHKLESYMQENVELAEKLEKLTAEKVSSAESIEIVESLTTQEKLEIERFNEGITQIETNIPVQSIDYFSPELNEDILKLSQDSVELHNKIELFTQERREVMGKMEVLRNENLLLNKNIAELVDLKVHLETELEALKNETVSLKDIIASVEKENISMKAETEIVLREKSQLELKLSDLMAHSSTIHNRSVESSEDYKKVTLCDMETQVEIINIETYESNSKAVKKLTKEILKFKNLLKEKNADEDLSSQREAQLSSVNDELMNTKMENTSLKEEKDALNNQILSLMEVNNKLSNDNESLTAESCSYIDIQKNNYQLKEQLKNKDISIDELRLLVSQLEKEVDQLNSALNVEKADLLQKSDEINQIQNEIVSLKDSLRLKDQLVDNIQNNLRIIEESKTNTSEKLKRYEEELLSLNHALDENENEINNLIKERDFNSREIDKLQNECKVKNEALTEISLICSAQSSEIEQLNRAISSINEVKATYVAQIDSVKQDYQHLSLRYNDIFEKHSVLESKNKDLLEKCKKFAFNLKKKHTSCAELEVKVQDLTVQLEKQHILNIEANKTVEDLNNQILSLSTQRANIESEAQTTSENRKALEEQNVKMQELVTSLKCEINTLNVKLDDLHSQADVLHLENETLKINFNDERLNNERLKTENEALIKLQQEYQLYSNLSEKVKLLENDLTIKKIEMEKLLDNCSQIQIAYDNFKFSHEAKLQERDLYIETLEIDILKYKDRTVKLEESISAMEERRFSLESNASQLGYQVQELLQKQKSVAEHSQYEDDLEQRMAALIAHDEIIEKQLEDSRSEIDELHGKIRNLLNVNQQQMEELHNFQNMAEKQRQEMNSINTLEEEKQSLLIELEKLQVETKRSTQNFQKSLKEQKEDFDNLENELQIEMESIKMEKRNLFEEYEKSLELISSLKDQLEESQQAHNWLRSEHDILLSNYSEVKSFKENSDLYERKYKEICKEVAKLETILQEKDLQIKNYKQASTESGQIVQAFSSRAPVSEDVNKKVTLSDYFSPISEPSFDILNQIVSPKDIDKSKEEIPNIDICTHMQEYQNSSDKFSSKLSSAPGGKTEVKEEVISPKAAYTCTSKETLLESGIETDALDEFEMNWGEDAHLEEKHYQVQSLAIQSSDDYKKLNQQVIVMKAENENLSKELSEIKAKLSRASKKMKELKSSNENLEAKILSFKKEKSNELDLAIQEELSSQLKKLEETASALQSHVDKNQAEKDSLSKQIDVLTSANERLIEMKEKMDCEIVTWKQKHKELSNRLSQFESFTDIKSFANIGTSSTFVNVQTNKSEIEELSATIKELTADNEELQAMLEELRHGKLELEKQVARQTMHCVSESDDVKVLRSQNEQYGNDLKAAENKLHDVEAHTRDLESKYADLKNKSKLALEEVNIRAESLNHLNAELSTRLDAVSSENMRLLHGLQKIENENRSLFEKLTVLQTDYQNLTQEKERLEYSYNHGVSDDVSNLLREKASIASELITMTEQYEHLLSNFNKMQEDHALLCQAKLESETLYKAEREKLLNGIDEKCRELTEVSNKLQSCKEECQKLHEKCLALESEKFDLLQKYNITKENNEKLSKYNLSVQEEYHKLEFELQNAILNNQKLQENENLYRKTIAEQQNITELSSMQNIEDENKRELIQQELAQRLSTYEVLFDDKESRLKSALIEIDDLHTNLSSKEREIEELRSKYSLLERQLSDTMFEKDAEIAKMRLNAYEDKTHYDAEAEKLKKEKDNLQNTLDSKMFEMRLALESQELEIVTLKETIAAFKTVPSDPVAQSKENKEVVEVQTSATAKDGDPNKAELDFALYLLHQRSIKCEELTLELSSLLEERDTLQLTLSDALRLNESLRCRTSPAIGDAQVEGVGEISSSISTAGSTGMNSMSSDELRNKLTELKSVKHQRDIRLREDQEQRQRELELMQMDIANLPEEAATKLRDAHYTLSRSAQSTSEVFMNWLMGKSAPKVVHNM